jgi:hypothetical protein
MKMAAGATLLSGEGFRMTAVRAAARPLAERTAAPGGEPLPSEWTGRNTRLSEYYRATGYPAYDAHPRYLGHLRGSWHDIGRQYGERAGDLIRMVYEGWYREVLPIQGSPAAIAAYLRHQEPYYQALVPEALELMHGIADGAAAELALSAFPEQLNHFDTRHDAVRVSNGTANAALIAALGRGVRR